jgi:flagellar basal-body rod protein FlgF
LNGQFQRTLQSEEGPLENPTYIVLSRLTAQERTMDVIATNLANGSTPGFKAAHMLFSDWLPPNHASALPGGEAELQFTQDKATWRDFTPGTLTHTGEPLDIAIGSSGFFTIKTPQGDRLTRAGRFVLQPDGTIGDDAGNALLDVVGSPMIVPPGEARLTIAGDGTISGEQGTIGKIGVVMPTDPNRLVAEGGHLMRSDSNTAPVTRPQLVQGAVEDSNVSPMIEMTRMIQLQRDFQMMTQFTQSESDRQQAAIDRLTQNPTA